MKTFFNIALTLCVVALLLALPFACGSYNIAYKKTIGVQSQSADREIFKETKSYNEGMVQDLARYKLEFEREKDEIARKAIANHINSGYSNFDEMRIQNRDLREFLIKIRRGDFK